MTRPLVTMTLSLVLGACAGRGGPGWLQEDIEADWPASLADLGAYADLRTLEPEAGLVEYTPSSPLWSSGTAKQRLLWLPDGATIDTTDPEGWDFPVGTALVKTFSLPDDAPRPRPIETRVIVRRIIGWDYATYVWNRSGRKATRLEGNWVAESLPVEDASGAWDYTVPARLDCRGCHENSEDRTGHPILGVDPLQIDAELAGSGWLLPEPEPAEIVGRWDEETAALRYFVGNCVHCHDGGEGENSSFSLFPDDAVASVVDQPAEGGLLVVPGDPDASVLYQTVTGDVARAGDAMPPLGIDRRDPEAKTLLRAWIESL